MATRTTEKTKLGLIATISLVVLGSTVYYDVIDPARRPLLACFIPGLVCGFLTIFLDTVVRGKGPRPARGPRKFGCTAKYLFFFLISTGAGFLFTWWRSGLAWITGHADFLSPEKISNWKIWTHFFLGLIFSVMLFEAARIKLAHWGIFNKEKESMKDEG